MIFLSAAGTSQGLRQTNQDAVCIRYRESGGKHYCMAVVCDGMGGLAAGETASASTVQMLDKWFEKRGIQFLDTGDLDGMIHNLLENIQQLRTKLIDFARSRQIMTGTTMSCLLIADTQYCFIHVGDTRIYRISADTITQLTTDHTVVAREIEAGRMTAEQALTSPDRNRLTQCIGTSRQFTPQVRWGTVCEDDVFLICSDGFRHKISGQELCQFFAPQNLHDEVQMTVQIQDVTQLVMERGEKDNITAAVVKCSD